MNKLYLILILVLVIPFCLFSQDYTVSVIPLNSSSGISEVDKMVITEYLESGLINTNLFEVIASDQRDTILGEQKFSLGGCSDQSCALEIGKLLSAQYMVFGSINRQGGSYILSVKKVNVETSKIDANAIETIMTLSASQIEETTLKLAHELAGLDYEGTGDRIASYTGSVRIQVEPASAKSVFNLSTEIESYPAVLNEVPVGEYPLRVSLEGYKTELLSVHVEKGKRSDINISLKSISGPIERPPAGQGFLTIYTSPPGMQVELDFHILNERTPIEKLPVIEGEHQIAVGDFTDFYYKTSETYITVSAGESIELPMELERSSGSLLVRCPIDEAEVFVNGKREGFIRDGVVHIRDIPTGQIEIAVMKDRYYTETMEVNLRPSKRTEIDVEIHPKPVRVVIDSNPAGAEVFFNGSSIGRTPTLTENVEQGLHQYYLEYNGYQTEKRLVTVSGTEDKTIIEDLTSNIRVSLTDTKDMEAEIYVDGTFSGETESGVLRIAGVSFGRHNIEIRKSGYETVFTNIVVGHDEYRLSKDLKLKDISFSVMTEPGGASVSVNDTLLEGLTPMTIELSEGRHEIVIWKKGYMPVTEEITVNSPRGMRIRKTLVEGENEEVLMTFYRDEADKLEKSDPGIFSCRRIAGAMRELNEELETYNLDVSGIRSYLTERENHYLRMAETLEKTSELMNTRIEELSAEREALKADRNKLKLFEGLSILSAGGAAAGTVFAVMEMFEAIELSNTAVLTSESEEFRRKANQFGWISAAGAAAAIGSAAAAIILPGNIGRLKKETEELTRDISFSAGILAHIEATRHSESTIDSETASFSNRLRQFSEEIEKLFISEKWKESLDMLEEARKDHIITLAENHKYIERVRQIFETIFNRYIRNEDPVQAAVMLKDENTERLWERDWINEKLRQTERESARLADIAEEERRREAAKFDNVLVNQWEIPLLLPNLSPVYENYIKWTVLHAAEEINRHGGISGKQLDIIIMNHEIRGQIGVKDSQEIMNRTLELSPLCILGPVSNPFTAYTGSLAAEEGVFAFTMDSSHETVSPFLPWLIAPEPSYGEIEKKVASTWASRYPDMTQAVIQSEGYINPMINFGYKNGLEKAGIYSDRIGIDTPLNGSPSDGVILNNSPGNALKMIQTLNDMSWEMDRILLTPSSEHQDIYTSGGPLLNGVMTWNIYNPNHDSERWRLFLEAGKKELGRSRMDEFIFPAFYDAVYMIKSAIEETGVTGNPEKLAAERILIRDYCNSLKNFEGIQHRWTMEDGVSINNPVYLFRIWNMEKELVEVIR